jgi:hypothetical protein
MLLIHYICREIEVLHGELAELTATAAKTNQKLEFRTKQFQLLLHALQDLQTDLTAETLESTPSEGTPISFRFIFSLYLFALSFRFIFSRYLFAFLSFSSQGPK